MFNLLWLKLNEIIYTNWFFFKNHILWPFAYRVHVFCFFFFFFLPAFVDFGRQMLLLWTVYALFTHCAYTVHVLKNIKNESHDTIYTFKYYFVTVFSVFSFQFSIFSNNKFNPNTPIKKYTDFSLETQTKNEKERSFFGSKIYFFSLSTPISYFSVYILKVKLMQVYKPNLMSLHHSPYSPQINKNKNQRPYKSFVSIYCTCFIYRTPYPIYLFIYRRF